MMKVVKALCLNQSEHLTISGASHCNEWDEISNHCFELDPNARSPSLVSPYATYEWYPAPSLQLLPPPLFMPLWYLASIIVAPNTKDYLPTCRLKCLDTRQGPATMMMMMMMMMIMMMMMMTTTTTTT